MSNINKELEKILSARYGKDVRQSIHDAIKEIDAVADTAQDSATQMAAMAGNHEASAKASMESALASAESARISAEQAMSGTPEGYEALVEQVGLLDIATSTGNTLYNSKKGGYRLNDLVGNTEQKTLSGKNLLDVPDAIEPLNGVTFKVNADKSITCTGTPTQTTPIYLLGSYSNPIAFPPGDYILSGSVSKNWYIRIRIYNADGTSKESNVSDGQFTINDGELMSVLIYLIHDAGDLGTITFYPMIRKADITDDTYEPYCGGTPSPNPLFPQAIENTFDVVEMISGYYSIPHGKWNSSSSGSVCCKHIIPCKVGDTIRIDTEYPYEMQVAFYNNGEYVRGDVFKDVVNTHSFEAKGSTEINGFAISILNTGKTPQTVGKIQLTVNGKYVGQIARYNKNLIVLDECTDQFVSSSLKESTDSTCRLSKLFEIGEYVYSWDSTSTGYAYIIYYDENKNIVHRANYNVTNSRYALIDVTKGSYFKVMGYKAQILNPQLEKGTVPSEYVEGKREVTTFFLNEPLRATDRVVRKDGVWNENHKRKTIVFDGSDDEAWAVSSSGLYYSVIEDAKRVLVDEAPIVYCDQYICKNNTNANMPDKTVKVCKSSTSTKAIAYIKDLDYTTVEDFKARLQANPITVEYVLEEETYTPLDTESQLALNSLETFDTVTYIEVDSKVKPTSISGEYGTSQVGAYTIKSLLNSENNAIKLNELAVALVATGRE